MKPLDRRTPTDDLSAFRTRETTSFRREILTKRHTWRRATQLLYGAFLKTAASRRLGVKAAIASALGQLTPSSYLLFHVSIPPIALRRIDPYLPIGELSGGNAGKYVRATYTEQQNRKSQRDKRLWALRTPDNVGQICSMHRRRLTAGTKAEVRTDKPKGITLLLDTVSDEEKTNNVRW